MRTKSLAIVCVIVFIDLLGFGMVLPLLTFYGERFGASPQQMANLSGVYAIAQLLFCPIWGSLSDRWGRRPVLIICGLGMGLGWLGFSCARSYTVLMAARMVTGLFSANLATAFAYVSDVTEPAHRAGYIGKVAAAYALGFVLGPAVGGVAGGHDLMLPPLLAFGLSCGAAAAAWAWLVEPRRADTGIPRAPLRTLGNPTVLRWSAALLALMVCYGAAEVTLPYLLARTPFQYDRLQGGAIFAYTGLVAVLVQAAAVPVWVRRRGEVPIVALGSVVFLCGLVLMSFTGTLGTLIIGCTLIAAGQAACYPTLLSLISRAVAIESQGTMLGLTQSISSLGRMLGPFSSGWLYVHVHARAPWMASAGFMLVVACLALDAHHRNAPHDRQPIQMDP